VNLPKCSLKLGVAAALLLLVMPAFAVAQAASDAAATIKVVGGSRVTLDVGAEAGVKPGSEATVWYELKLGTTRKRVSVARIRVTSVHPRSADATVVASTERLQTGYQVSFDVELERPNSGASSSPAVCEGQVLVRSDPAGAAVSVDGRRAADAAPALLERVPCGRHVVSLTAPYHEDAQQDVNVTAGRTEQVTLTLRRRKAQARVTTTPAGAEVTIDGQRRGVAPLAFELDWGEHRVRIDKPGLGSVESTIVVDRATAEYRFALPQVGSVQSPGAPTPSSSCHGQLFVKTDPPGATIRVDARLLDEKSPVFAEGIACGSRQVSATLPNHEDTDRHVTVQNGRAEQLALTLMPRRARLRITARPNGSEVFVNGQRRGQTPLMVDDLGWGEHRLRVEKAGFEPLERTLLLDRSFVEQDFVLTAAAPRMALLRISTFGFEATSGVPGLLTLGLLTTQYAIEVDDKVIMDWRFRAEETSIQIPPGDHRLRILVRNALVRAVDAVHDERIVVNSNQETVVSVNFLLSRVTVNGNEGPFTYMSWQNQRR
jgi:hypothetical protein